jgi:hypothetical protein
MSTRVAPPTQYHVYVIELDPAARRARDCDGADPGPPVYVGQSALTPEERFDQHRAGRRASRIVRAHGVRLRPDLSTGWGPYGSRREAEAAEAELADHLRARGHCVRGGT